MIGVPIMEPNTPPLEMVNVPPSISSIASSFVLAFATKNKKKIQSARSWFAHLEMLSLNFSSSSFEIQVNLLHPPPSSFP